MYYKNFSFVACFAIILWLAANASAVQYFSTGFHTPPLHPGLEDPDGAFAIASERIQRNPPLHSEDRHYVRTTDSDYFTTGNFAFEVSFTTPVSDPIGTIQFIGLGSATPNSEYYSEPGPLMGVAGTGTGSLNLRIHSPDIVEGRVDWAFNYGVPGDEVFFEQIGNLTSRGPHRARIAVKGDLITMQVDENYTGSLTPTISSTIDLALYPQIKTALLNESRAFFGTAQSIVHYENFVIVPEPTGAALWIVAVAGARIRRKRK